MSADCFSSWATSSPTDFLLVIRSWTPLGNFRPQNENSWRRYMTTFCPVLRLAPNIHRACLSLATQSRSTVLYCMRVVLVKVGSRSSRSSTRHCVRRQRCDVLLIRGTTLNIRRCRSRVCRSPTSAPLASYPSSFSAHNLILCPGKPCRYW